MFSHQPLPNIQKSSHKFQNQNVLHILPKQTESILNSFLSRKEKEEQSTKKSRNINGINRKKLTKIGGPIIIAYDKQKHKSKIILVVLAFNSERTKCSRYVIVKTMNQRICVILTDEVTRSITTTKVEFRFCRCPQISPQTLSTSLNIKPSKHQNYKFNSRNLNKTDFARIIQDAKSRIRKQQTNISVPEQEMPSPDPNPIAVAPQLHRSSELKNKKNRLNV